MPTRNLLNSNMWQIVAPDANNEPSLIFNKYLPYPTRSLQGAMRPDGLTTFVDYSSGVLSAIVGFGVAQFVPYMTFNGTASGGAGQTFTNNLLNFYANNPTFATITVDGAVLDGNDDYTISGNVLEIFIYLLPFQVVEVHAKTLPRATPSVDEISTQDGNIITTQAGDVLVPQASFTL